MRIRGQAGLVAEFVTEMKEAIVVKAPFKVSARIHSRRGMPLKVNKISRLIAVAGVEEVIESNFKQRGQRRIGGDVATDARIFLVLVMYHRHRVPADESLNAPFNVTIAGVGKLFFNRNGIAVVGGELAASGDARFCGA